MHQALPLPPVQRIQGPNELLDTVQPAQMLTPVSVLSAVVRVAAGEMQLLGPLAEANGILSSYIVITPPGSKCSPNPYPHLLMTPNILYAPRS